MWSESVVRWRDSWGACVNSEADMNCGSRPRGRPCCAEAPGYGVVPSSFVVVVGEEYSDALFFIDMSPCCGPAVSVLEAIEDESCRIMGLVRPLS